MEKSKGSTLKTSCFSYLSITLGKLMAVKKHYSLTSGCL